MDKSEAMETIGRAIRKISILRNGAPGSPDHIAFIQSTGLDLARVFGPDSIISKNFGSIDYWSTGHILTFASTYERDAARARQNAFIRGLNMAEGILRSVQEQLDRNGVDRLLRAGRAHAEGVRVFVSHGGETPALSKLDKFLRSFGVRPIIVGREPSEGLSVDDLVEKRMADADCVIVLATGDDETSAGRQPRANVIHEIGLSQKLHSDRIIYLKEVGCHFPSNIAPKVWENFVTDNMEAAFEKVLKELHAFGLV
jgi:predicted nucleotide-binding protein